MGASVCEKKCHIYGIVPESICLQLGDHLSYTVFLPRYVVVTSVRIIQVEIERLPGNWTSGLTRKRAAERILSEYGAFTGHNAEVPTMRFRLLGRIA